MKTLLYFFPSLFVNIGRRNNEPAELDLYLSIGLYVSVFAVVLLLFTFVPYGKSYISKRTSFIISLCLFLIAAVFFVLS